MIQTFKQLVGGFKENKDIAFSDFETQNQITYDGLFKKIHIYNSHLHEISEGDKVVMFDVSNIDWVCIYFAVILRGGIIVPVDTRVSESFLDSVIENINPKIVISNSLKASNVTVLSIEELLSQKHLSVEESYIDTNYEGVAEILFTSGTWGIPKGVMLSQKNILTNAYQILDIYNHKKADTILSILPMSHAYQQTTGLIVPLIVGSHMVFLEKPDSFKLVRVIKKYKIKTAIVVPKVLNSIEMSVTRKIKSKIIRNGFKKLVIFSSYLPNFLRKIIFSYIRNQLGTSLENFIVGGALLDKDTDDFFQGLGYRVHVGYGLTETSPVISVSVSKKRKLGNVGQIVKGLSFSKNNDGELLVSGDNLFLGYYPHYSNQEFNTGDIVDFEKNGDLILRGRTKNLIIWPTGDKIFAEDLEHIISNATDSEEVCVVYKLIQGNPIIYCAIKSDQPVEIDIKYVHSKLPNNIKIERFLILNKTDFPCTHTLKPNRQKILEIFTK